MYWPIGKVLNDDHNVATILLKCGHFLGGGQGIALEHKLAISVVASLAKSLVIFNCAN